MERPDLELDKNSQQGFISFYRSLGDAEPGTIRLFERNSGEYYSAHGSDALYVAREFYRTTSVLKTLGSASNGLQGCTLSKASFESFVSDALQNRQIKLQVYGPAEPRSRNSSWQIIKEASPGNLQAFEDCLPDITSDPVVVAVQIETGAAGSTSFCVGLALANATDKTLGLVQFEDNDLLTNLESLLVQLGAKECVLPEVLPGDDGRIDRRMMEILTAVNVVVTRIAKKHFKLLEAGHIERLLSTSTPADAAGASGYTPAAAEEAMRRSPLAATALGALVAYLDLLADISMHHVFTLVEPKPATFMRLDAHAVVALDLVGEGARKPAHLYGLLNKTVTGPGARLLHTWIRQPLASRADVEGRLDCVQSLVDDSAACDALRSFLGHLPDLSRLAKKLRRGKASLQDVIILYQMALRLPNAAPLVQGLPPIAERYEEGITKGTESLAPFLDVVEATIDLDAVENHQFLIRASFDDELRELKDQMEELENEIRPETVRVARELGLELNKVLKVENNSQYGYHLRVSRAHANLLRSKDYIELSTLKAGVLFTTAKMRAKAMRILELHQRYDTQQRALVKELMQALEAYIPTFQVLNEVFSEIDVLAAFAHVAVHAPTPYTRPAINDEGTLHLPGCRHPCIEVQDGMHFIPNSVHMARGESDFAIITGPNMGGKSSYCRAAALAALMAQIGCFVACDAGASVPMFDAILCRIGASDNQMRGVSTFMAEMLETAAVLRAATARSLVIVDELGRGTSTHDGFGLAWAIAHYLATKVHAFALFATHFHELTFLADDLPNVRNLHVVAHVSETVDDASGTGENGVAPHSSKHRDITLLYKVAEGACDESFGIHVAEMAGFPASVVALAKRKVDQLEAHSHAQGDGNAPVKRACTSTGTGSSEPAADVDGAESMIAANEVVTQFLAEFKRIDLQAPGAREQIKELRAKFGPRIEASPYLAELVNDFQSSPRR